MSWDEHKTLVKYKSNIPTKLTRNTSRFLKYGFAFLIVNYLLTFINFISRVLKYGFDFVIVNYLLTFINFIDLCDALYLTQ